MKVELFPFQKRALKQLRFNIDLAMSDYQSTHAPQIISFTAPTGAGKTIIMASLIESIFYGDEDNYDEKPNSIFVWLSDSPQLNEQSKMKIDSKADKIRLEQCVTVSEDSFDKEVFEDGHIYFLNTQKLSKSSNLTKNGDNRTYNIWQTIANTVREKSDHLYFIIDEAHRGMQDKDVARATSIMQKFIKGSEKDGIPPMPLVIGMSATMERFNNLISGTNSHPIFSIITPDDVRSSGLLKDRIVIIYPDAGTSDNDMALLQAASDDWKEKWEHWTEYCRSQHYAYINPVMIIQVLNGTKDKLTETDLGDCLNKIEERIGYKFGKGQVVQTFGQNASSIMVNGLEVPYVEPSRIAENKNIRVVFFKENLSTGWDCPRAETMMSFRTAKDSTYIAQLLGRMIRTPMQSRIQVDDILNDVRLFLPKFDRETVDNVVKALQSAEGGNIPTEAYGESLTNKKYDTLTIKPIKSESLQQIPKVHVDNKLRKSKEETSITKEEKMTPESQQLGNSDFFFDSDIPSIGEQRIEEDITSDFDSSDFFFNPTVISPEVENTQDTTVPQKQIDREEIVRFINNAEIKNYSIKVVRVNKYFKSLMNLTRFLKNYGINTKAYSNIRAEIVEKIHDYIEGLKESGTYSSLVQKVSQVKLATQTFDVYGKTLTEEKLHEFFASSSTADIDRQFYSADTKLYTEGIGIDYGKKYMDGEHPDDFKIDFILFVSNDDCFNKLEKYAEKKYHEIIDENRILVSSQDTAVINEYNKITSNGDAVSETLFQLPETISVPHDEGGKNYYSHLFVDERTGYATMKLNSWESGVIEEEEKNSDFVCWMRNSPKASWALRIPYELNNETKAMYPDFIVVRKNETLGYVIDILEPHGNQYTDNLAKAQGLAKYAKKNSKYVGRIQLIRMSNDIGNSKSFIRLDVSKSAICEKVLKAKTNEELDNIFLQEATK